MPFSLIPHRVYSSIYDITPHELGGISLLLADLDNTLAKYGQHEPDSALFAWKKELEEAGITLFLLSNSRKPGRAARFAKALGVSYLGKAGKPGVAGFRRALAQAGIPPQKAAMVGDQIFTDIFGARRSGILALLVEPIELRGNPGRYLRYAVETPFRVLGRRR